MKDINFLNNKAFLQIKVPKTDKTENNAKIVSESNVSFVVSFC